MALNHKNNLSVFYAHVLYSSLQIGESIQFGVNVFFVYFLCAQITQNERKNRTFCYFTCRIATWSFRRVLRLHCIGCGCGAFVLSVI